jgi:hypothetical protein
MKCHSCAHKLQLVMCQLQDIKRLSADIGDETAWSKVIARVKDIHERANHCIGAVSAVEPAMVRSLLEERV